MRPITQAVVFVALGTSACVGKPKVDALAPEDKFDLGGGKLLLTYRADDRVAILDPARLGEGASAIERLIPVGGDPAAAAGPHEALLGPDAKTWFVTIQQGPSYLWGKPVPETTPDGGCPETNPHCAHMGGEIPGGVEAYRVADNAFLGRVETGYGAAQMAITPDGEKMYVTSFDTSHTGCGRIAVVNPRTMTIRRVLGRDPAAPDSDDRDDLELRLPRGPHGAAVTPDGSKVIVAAYWDRLVVIDTATDGVRKIPIGDAPPPIGECATGAPAYVPNTVVVAPDGKRAYFTLAGTAFVPPAVGALDLETSTIVPDFRVRTNRGPQQVAITPDGRRLVVACDGATTLDVIDVATGAKEDIDLAGTARIKNPFGVAVSPDGTRAYVAAACAERISDNCVDLRHGAIVEVDITTSPPTFVTKVTLGGGVTHVSYARPGGSP